MDVLNNIGEYKRKEKELKKVRKNNTYTQRHKEIVKIYTIDNQEGMC